MTHYQKNYCPHCERTNLQKDTHRLGGTQRCFVRSYQIFNKRLIINTNHIYFIQRKIIINQPFRFLNKHSQTIKKEI